MLQPLAIDDLRIYPSVYTHLIPLYWRLFNVRERLFVRRNGEITTRGNAWFVGVLEVLLGLS